MQESQLRKWSWKIANFTLIWSQNIVTDVLVSEIFRNEFFVKNCENLASEMVMENRYFDHGKSWKSHGISFPRFRGNPGKGWFLLTILKSVFQNFNSWQAGGGTTPKFLTSAMPME